MSRTAADPYSAGLAFAAAGRHAEAISSLEAALARAPNDARILFALGATAQTIGHAPAAERFYRQVLAQEPDRIEALVNLANMMRGQARFLEVRQLLTAALQRKPETAELWLTLGSALREAGDVAGGAMFYREALRIKPDYAQALGNLADLIADDGKTDEALALYDRVLALQPKDAQARLNRAILHFLKGDLPRAWADYESRLAVKGKALDYRHGLKPWDGRYRRGLRLLVTAEQGVGDQLMFASLLPEVAERAAGENTRVLLDCEPRLAELFARSFPGIAVHRATVEGRGGEKIANYDWLDEVGGADVAIPIGSLARLMRPALEDFPNPHSYLRADESVAAHYAAQFAGWPKPIIGLCWRSGNTAGLRGQQFAPLEYWGAFANDLPGTLVSLQYDATGDELVALNAMTKGRLRIPDFDQKHDIDRGCAVIAGLDAVVSAPTAVSWMAAGLGVPTYKILYNTSWTSFGAAFEPFAPSCLCMTPSSSGDWMETFVSAAARLSADLRL